MRKSLPPPDPPKKQSTVPTTTTTTTTAITTTTTATAAAAAQLAGRKGCKQGVMSQTDFDKRKITSTQVLKAGVI